MVRGALVLLWLAVASYGSAQLSWLGETKLFLYGQAFPSRAGFIEEGQTITVTTQTFPIAPGQSVSAFVTTNNWQTTQEYVFSFDKIVGNNTQWYGLLGPFPSGSEVKFFIRAQGNEGGPLFDNNGGQNFSFYTRYTPRYRPGAILQWFETDYRVIMQRLPEVARVGYTAIYLPPPQKSPGGGFSTGYNPFDRFDLGERLMFGTVRTRYGTSQELHELILMAKRFGIEIYADLVYNHNSNRAHWAIDRYPDAIPEDFHIRSSSDTGNNEIDFNVESSFSFGMLNHDLVGLVDFAHEDHNNTRTGAFNLPSFASFNGSGKPNFVRHPRNPHYYPGFQSYADDVRGLLKRWGWFLTNHYGFEGYRLDAVKHTPPAFFDFVPDADQPGSYVSNGDAMVDLFGINRNLYIFAEDYTSNAFELREYAKTGMNLLDFPLKFNFNQVFNSSGFGNLGGTFSSGWGLDGATGLAYENGGLGRDVGVSFVQSHDDGPAWSNNLAHALMFTRPGRPLVYYDGNNLDPNNYNQFPKPGRYDSLGNGGDTTTRMVDVRNRFARGAMVNRWVEDRVYIVERQVSGFGTLLTGMNLRGDEDQTRTVMTAFAPNTVLRDYSGQRPDVTVEANGSVTITIPSNSTPTNQNNARGYVFYAPVTPEGTVKLFNSVGISNTLGSEIPFQTYSMPSGWNAAPQTYEAATVGDERFHLTVSADPSGFSAVAKLDSGIALGGLTPLQNTPEGLSDGFVPLAKLGPGQFELKNIRTNDLVDGLHVLRVRVFTNTPGRPGMFSEFVRFFYVQRARPFVMDGVLTEYGAASANQTRTPSSQANRLDQLFFTNDDQYLYVGLAGNVDVSENKTNGVAFWLDTDPDGPSGIQALDALDDDSSPATRLLSNARVTVQGIRPDFGLGVLRRSTASTAPGAHFTGQPALTPAVGAHAGLYRYANNLKVLSRRRVAVAWQPRTGPFENPPKGLEAAIPLRELFTANPPPAVRMLAYLLTTGETGNVLSSTDPLRGTYGGYGNPVSWVSNQFLPPQATIVNDPGTQAITAPYYVQRSLLFMRKVETGFSLTASPVTYDLNNRLYRQAVTLTNTAASRLNGWLALRVATPPGVTLMNRTDMSLVQPSKAYRVITYSSLNAGQSLTFTLEYRANSAVSVQPQFELFSGRGIL